MTLSLEAFIKAATSARLNSGEKHRQALQFAGLGMTTLPALALVQQRIKSGRWIPKDVKPGRFLGAAVLGGAFWGGVLPTIRRGIAQTNLSKARARMKAEKEMRALTPGGVQQALKQLPVETAPMVEKTGASKIVTRMNGLLKCRKGRRPARVETFLKKSEYMPQVRNWAAQFREAAGKTKEASPTGRDLRAPMMGGTKFPTGDSLAEAKSKLKEHQNVAKPKMVRPTVQPVYGVNSMPKFGSAFSDDPLVQYLKKMAQGPKTSTKVDGEGKLDDNLEVMKTDPGEEPLTDVGAGEEPERGDRTSSNWRKQLNSLFENKKGITGKYLDRHHTGGKDMVTKELKKHTHSVKGA